MYLKEAFKERLNTKVKMVIISMPRKTLIEVVTFIILVEEKLHVR